MDYSKEFPTPRLLREANVHYSALQKPPPRDENNGVLPYPTASTKRERFRVEDYAQIDEHALTTPRDLAAGPLKDLTNHLCSVAQNDMSKVRVLFRWLTGQNLAQIDVDKYRGAGADTAMSYLIRLKLGKGGYSALFVDLCKNAGLNAAEIKGLTKATWVNPDEASHNTWAAVNVDDEWRLFDPHWSARHETGGGGGEWELIDDTGKDERNMETASAGVQYKHNETYFFTDPEEFIYTHFPLDGEQWQMLARPVTEEEFRAMVFLTPAFFKLGLGIVSHKQCHLDAEDGEVEFELGLPHERRSFMFKLWLSSQDGDVSVSVADVKLERYVFVRQVDHKLIVKVSFPLAGKYKFALLAHDAENKSGQAATYEDVCIYLVSTGPAKNDIQPFPENSRTEWGPGSDMLLGGLRPASHTEAVIESKNGMVDIRLKADKPVEILHEIHSNTKNKEQLKNYVMHQVDGEDILVSAKLPEPGLYALNLYVKEAGTEGTFKNVCTYLLSCTQGAVDCEPYPEVPNGRLGPTDSGKQSGITCISHQSAIIVAPDSGELEIDLALPGVFGLSSHLYHYVGTDRVNMDKYILTSQSKNKANFKLQLPAAGYYWVEVFGKEISQEGDKLPNIYNLVIQVPTPKVHCVPFPKAYAAYTTKQCQLECPTAGQLPCNQKVPFSVIIPEASRVATISGNQWTHLEKNGEKWRGQAETGDAGTEQKLLAAFEENPSSFEILLIFDVIETDHIHEALRKQEEADAAAARQREQEEADAAAARQRKKKKVPTATLR